MLLFALLRAADDAVAARQDEVILRSYGATLLQRVHESLPVARGMRPTLRLPAVQQLIPSVRRMTAGRAPGTAFGHPATGLGG